MLIYVGDTEKSVDTWEVDVNPANLSAADVAALRDALATWSGEIVTCLVDDKADGAVTSQTQVVHLHTESGAHQATIELARWTATLTIVAAAEEAESLYQSLRTILHAKRKPLWPLTHGDLAILLGALVLAALLYLVPAHRLIVAFAGATIWLVFQFLVLRNQSHHMCDFLGEPE